MRLVDGAVSDILSLLAHAGAAPRKASSVPAIANLRLLGRLCAVSRWVKCLDILSFAGPRGRRSARELVCPGRRHSTNVSMR